MEELDIAAQHSPVARVPPSLAPRRCRRACSHPSLACRHHSHHRAALLCHVVCCVCDGAGIANALKFISNREKCPTVASLLTPIQKKKKGTAAKGKKGKKAAK